MGKARPETEKEKKEEDQENIANLSFMESLGVR